ncbi:MAG: TonB-dependent receptor [Limnohabitans sp.]
MHTHPFLVRALTRVGPCLLLAGLAVLPARAQPTSGAGDELVITGNPLGREVAPASVGSLSGADLRERGQGSLGETLTGLPGVSSTYFGPQASRPMVRGLDGERVRLLSNSGASHDVSALSYDHAVPTDVLSADRIEVLRGPAALLYGGSAMGGVVNVLDNRIPREAIEGLQGRVQLQGASGNRESSGAALLETGDGTQAWHVDAFERRSGDVRVPNAAGRIPNSDSTTRGGALGFSHFGEGARMGLSASTWRSDYGSVAEDQTRIGMRSDKLAFEGEWRSPWAGWQNLKLLAGASDYSHTEFDAGTPGTVFAKRGQDLRVEARHQPLGPLEGVVGLQWEDGRFKVDGAEAFMPYTQSRSQALFALEAWRTSWGQLQAGARLEQVSVRSDGSPSSSSPFVIGERRFNPVSFSLGGQYRLAGDWQATGQLAHSERAPSDAELFANGPHMATHTWERGNDALKLEQSNSVELGLERRTGPNPMQFSVYQSQFSNFIGLMATGRILRSATLPEYTYEGVRARLRGWEASGQSRLLESVLQGAGTFDLHWRADQVLADNLSTGAPLPRIAPWRAGLSGVYRFEAWQARLGFDHAAAQRRVPSGSEPTAAYTLWHASLNYRQQASVGTVHWFARLDNLNNALAYSATSILTSTVPGRVPLPGRSLKLGAQWQF